MNDLATLKAMLARARITFIESRTESPTETNVLISIHTSEAEFWTTFVFTQNGSLNTMRALIELTGA